MHSFARSFEINVEIELDFVLQDCKYAKASNPPPYCDTSFDYLNMQHPQEIFYQYTTDYVSLFQVMWW